MSKKKKIKFKKITFKLSQKQFNIVERFCKIKKISPNKLFKKAIKDYIVTHYDFTDDANYEISENQLDLFDLVEELEAEYNNNQEKK